MCSPTKRTPVVLDAGLTVLRLCACPRSVIYNTECVHCLFPAVLEEQGRSCWTASSSTGSTVLSEARGRGLTVLHLFSHSVQI